jgi:transcriptional regulator with XRE-family HTH domain
MFGQNLRRLRLKNGLTQAQVAESAKIHKRYYQDLEACLKIPSVVIAARLRKALRCDWNELTRGIIDN